MHSPKGFNIPHYCIYKRYTSDQRPSSIVHNFSFTSGSVFAFSWSPNTHTSPLSTLEISALKYANRLPICTKEHFNRTSVPCGIGRRYVVFRCRLTPPKAKMPGRDMPSRMAVERTSTRVAAQPPCRLPM